MLRVGPEQPGTINQITVSSTQAIVNKHDAVFRGVGRLKDYQLKIHIDPEVTPVAHPRRLQQVQCCLNGAEWPDVPDLKPHERVKDELCANNGVILGGSRIVMPSTLW